LKKARKVFDVQLNKSHEAKWECVENQIGTSFHDKERFCSEYLKHADRMLDSISFRKECSSLGVNAECVAEHIVFRGSAEINRVLNQGVRNTIGNDVKLYDKMFLDHNYAGAFRSETASGVSVKS